MLGPVGMMGTLHLPFRHLALDYPGIGSSAAKWIQPPKKCSDCPRPEMCVTLRVVRGKRRPVGPKIGVLYAAL